MKEVDVTEYTLLLYSLHLPGGNARSGIHILLLLPSPIVIQVVLVVVHKTVLWRECDV